MTTPQSHTKTAASSILRIFLFLAIIYSALALPISVTPAGDRVPMDVGQRTEISNQNLALGTVFIVFGLIEVFWGFKFIRLTLIVIGFLSWAVIAMVIMVAIRWDLIFTTFDPKFYYLWVWLSAGLAGAILSFRYWDIGVTLAGAFGGFAVAMGIVAAANLAIENAGRYIIMSVLILGGATIATFFERVFIILATSFGGAYMFMFGVDEFTQVGYREMIVIFDFTGKTLTYHPNLEVYTMLASSLVIATLGAGWEFWHHGTPLLMDRKAVFRIYGRPFGKRPKKLVGQRIHRRLKTKSDFYAYIIGCVCLQRWSIDDVLYNDEDTEIVRPAPIHSPISGGQSAGSPSGVEDKESKPTTPMDGDNDPVKPAPIEDYEHVPHKVEKNSESITTIIGSPDSSGSETRQESQATRTEHTEHTETTQSEHKEHSETTHTEHYECTETTYSGSHGSVEPAVDNEATSPGHPIGPRLEPYHHPLFSPQVGEHTVDMINLVIDDSNPSSTSPRDLLPRNRRVLEATSPPLIWPASTSTMNVASTVSHAIVHGLHMLEVSESSEGSYESVDSKNPLQFSPNVIMSTPVSKHTMVPESLLSPTIDFPKPKSAGGAPSDSSKTSKFTSTTGYNFPDLVKESQSNHEPKKDGNIPEESKEDPLATQVWRLYSKAKDSLPNAQRLENLTWRMMAMTLHKNEECKQSLASQSPPSPTDTISGRNIRYSHSHSDVSKTTQSHSGYHEAKASPPDRYPTTHGYMPPQTCDTSQKSLMGPNIKTFSPTSLASSTNETLDIYTSVSQQQISQSTADLIMLETVIQDLEMDNDASFENTETGSPLEIGNSPQLYRDLSVLDQQIFLQFQDFANSHNQSSTMDDQINNRMAQANTMDFTYGYPSSSIYPLEHPNQQLPQTSEWSIKNPRMEYMDIQPRNLDIGQRSGSYSASTSEKPLPLSSETPSSTSSETEEDTAVTATPTQCTNCKTRTTPLWRRDDEGNSLCNACGLFLKLHGRVRPLSLKTDVVRKRNRGGMNSKTTKKTQERIHEKEDLDNQLTKERGEGYHRHKRPSMTSSRTQTRNIGSVAEFADAGEGQTLPVPDRTTTTSTNILTHLETRNPLLPHFSDPLHYGPGQTSPKRRRRLTTDAGGPFHELQPRKDQSDSWCSPTLSSPPSPCQPTSVSSSPSSLPIHELALLPEFQQIIQEQQLRYTQQQQQQQQQYQLMLYLAQQQQQQRQQQQQQQQQLRQQLEQYLASSMASPLQIPPQLLVQHVFPQIPIMTTTNMYSKIATPSFDPPAAATATASMIGQEEWSSLAAQFPSENEENETLSEEQQQQAVAILLNQFRAKLTNRQ
ncbi:hypothetical protein BGX27_002424 [Mortierella sp. AM989]|nr:hypothetical protein BGX27_002424 [Mortierella sp. AM989]